MTNNNDILNILKQPAIRPRESGWHVTDQLHRTVFESATKSVAEKYVATHSQPNNPLRIVDYRRN